MSFADVVIYVSSELFGVQILSDSLANLLVYDGWLRCCCCWTTIRTQSFMNHTAIKTHICLFLVQGFKGHQLHDVLSAPGTADLTADVDFSYLRRIAGEGVACLGPVTQRTFLKNMGIDTRMQVSLTAGNTMASHHKAI